MYLKVGTFFGATSFLYTPLTDLIEIGFSEPKNRSVVFSELMWNPFFLVSSSD